MCQTLIDYAKSSLKRFDTVEDTTGRVLAGGVANRWNTRLKVLCNIHGLNVRCACMTNPLQLVLCVRCVVSIVFQIFSDICTAMRLWRGCVAHPVVAKGANALGELTSGRKEAYKKLLVTQVGVHRLKRYLPCALSSAPSSVSHGFPVSPCVTLQVALNYLDSQPRPGKIEARLLKMAGVQ